MQKEMTLDPSRDEIGSMRIISDPAHMKVGFGRQGEICFANEKLGVSLPSVTGHCYL